MKKVLLILFVLAICVLAFPHGVMALPGTDSAIVNAEIKPTALVFDVTDPTGTWTMLRGTNNLEPTNTIKIEIDSSLVWTVTAVGSGADHTGHMISATAPATFLQNAVMIESTMAPAGFKSLETSQNVQTGPAGNKADTVFSPDLSQLVDDSDFARNDYKITIAFTCTES
jgi:hypothetical protein